MKIALVAPLVSRIDDEQAQPGGAQALLADLAAGLASRGHRVTLLATKGSRVRGVDVVDLDLDSAAFTPAALHRAQARTDDAAQREGFARIAGWLREHRAEWDVAHAHAYDAPAFEALAELPPVVHTLHLAPLDPIVVTAAARAAAAGAILASVSRANAAAWTSAGASVSEVLPNGVPVDRIRYAPGRRTGLLFAGRIAPEKGPDVAIRAARRAGKPLLLVGPIYDRSYYETVVRPLEGSDAASVGAVTRDDLYERMAASEALLVPAQWDEPFGLVAVEAQAAGTPVVAFARGGLVEVVEDQRSGYLVRSGDEDAFVDAIGRVDRIDRAACRANAELWSIPAMIDAHEKLYARLVRSA